MSKKELQQHIWNNVDKLKFKLLQATLTQQTIQDAIKKQLEFGMDVSYKTIKHMKRDLHNNTMEIKLINKLIRKENLRAQQAAR